MANAFTTTIKWIKKTGLAKAAKTDAWVNWYRDPLSHPDIARMSERERADLQFMPEAVKSE